MSIAFDAAASSLVNPATSLTFAHTCTGSNLVLFLGIQTGTDGGTTDITSVTYGGTAMTQLNVQQLANSGEHIYLYYLVAPATGSNNIVINKTNSGFIAGFSASYTGARQSSIPDASTTNTGSSTTSLATSVTSVADNCWFIYAATDSSGNFSSLTNGTVRAPGSSPRFIADSNSALTPAGSYTITYNAPGSTTIWANMASFAPVSSPAASTSRFRSLLGVGQ